MAECLDITSDLVAISDTHKKDCSSPSSTETVCLEIDNTLPNHSSKPSSVENSSEKSQFFNFLGLGDKDKQSDDADCEQGEGEDALDGEEHDEEETCDNDKEEETWEDCMDHIETNDISQLDLDKSTMGNLGYLASNVVTPRRSTFKRRTRKRKLIGCPSVASLDVKRAHTDDDGAATEATLAATPTTPTPPLVGPGGGGTPRTPRAVIPTKDNPPPEMNDWLAQFNVWSNAERILAINELITRCTPSQVRHMMQVIEPQFQRDFISLLPRELALSVLAFLGPRDLARAAQTCRSWRYLAEDNLLWREKCREAGVAVTLEAAGGGGGKGGWKAAYMRQHKVTMNWWSNALPQARLLKGHDDHVITCLQFCGNRIVSGSDDNTLKVWSAASGRCLRTLVGHTGGVWSSQMSHSTIISGSTDRTLKVWNADTGICLHTLYGHTSTVRCMHLHKGRVVSGSRDATLRVWDVTSGECLHVLVGHQAAVRCVQYDGRLVVSGAYDYMVKVWCVETEECLHTLQGHTNRVYSLQFDGVHVVSGSLDTSIRVWEVETGACKHTLMGHQSLTSGMELRNNILVSGNADSTVKVWDIVTGQCLQTLSGAHKHQSAVTCLQFNTRFVITSSDDGTVKLWDVRTGDFIRNLVALDSGGSGGVVWRIRASDTKLVCAVGSRNGTEETKLLVLDFDLKGGDMLLEVECGGSGGGVGGSDEEDEDEEEDQFYFKLT